MKSIRVTFDRAAHTADALQRAAYRLSSRLSMELVREDDRYVCTLFVPDEAAAEDAAADFRIEVVDQVLRERIRGETEGARNLILALAFSKTALADD